MLRNHLIGAKPGGFTDISPPAVIWTIREYTKVTNMGPGRFNHIAQFFPLDSVRVLALTLQGTFNPY